MVMSSLMSQVMSGEVDGDVQSAVSGDVSTALLCTGRGRAVAGPGLRTENRFQSALSQWATPPQNGASVRLSGDSETQDTHRTPQWDPHPVSPQVNVQYNIITASRSCRDSLEWLCSLSCQLFPLSSSPGWENERCWPQKGECLFLYEPAEHGAGETRD